ncbi:unnamed protein product [Phaeothamnion confervicola]
MFARRVLLGGRGLPGGGEETPHSPLTARGEHRGSGGDGFGFGGGMPHATLSERLDSTSTQRLDSTRHPLDATWSGDRGMGAEIVDSQRSSQATSADPAKRHHYLHLPHLHVPHSMHFPQGIVHLPQGLHLPHRHKHDAEWEAAKAARMKRKARGGAGLAPDRMVGLFMKDSGGVLDPRSDWMLAWMIVVSIVTIGTAVSTPVELGWFNSPTEWAANPFFLAFNIIVITIFALDMIVNFNLAYFDEDLGTLVTSRRKIAREYFKLWFALDFLATFPFDACVGNSSGQAAQIFRLFKLFRLLRVFKILGSKRFLRMIEADYAVNYDAFSLVGFAFTMLLMMHLMACGLFFVGSRGDHATADDDHYGSAFDSEFTSFEINNRIAGDTVAQQWLFCFYWAAMTVSTIGYGDVSLPTNNVRAYATVCMLVGASAYAYMVGALIQVILNMNQHEQDRRKLLAHMNDMTRTIGMPTQKRKEIRLFFSKTNGGQSILEGYLSHLGRLSPPLAGAIVNHMMQDWLANVWWLQPAIGDNGFLIGFVRLLREQSFAEHEPVFQADDAASVCYVVRVGNVEVRGHGRFFAEGMGVGEEILMHRRQEYGYSVQALSYLNTWRIERDSFHDFVHVSSADSYS